MLGVEVGRVDRLLQVETAVDAVEEDVQSPLLLLVAAGRAVREPRLAVTQDEPRRQRCARSRARDERRCEALLEPDICARDPSGQPSAGIVGELWSQPPEGVAEKTFPNRSATSRWTVSPRVGSPTPSETVSPGVCRVGRRPKPGR